MQYSYDIKHVLEELREGWQENPEQGYNRTALTKLRQVNDSYMFCCPHHSEERPSCGILMHSPYYWNCFGCDSSGNLESLVAHVLDLPSEIHAFKWLLRNFVTVTKEEREKIDLDRLFLFKNTSKNTCIEQNNMLRFNSQRLEYMLGRGFTEHTLQKYEVSYDEEIEAVVFPVKDRNGWVRFLKRRLVSQKQFLNAKDVYRKDIVYGLYYLINAPKPITKIYLTESETDTMACYQAGMAAGAIQGRVLYDEQIRELLLAGIKEIILFFDNDEQGIEATRIAEDKLLRFPFKVGKVIYPKGKYKDANDLLRDGKIKEIKEKAYEYNFNRRLE